MLLIIIINYGTHEIVIELLCKEEIILITQVSNNEGKSRTHSKTKDMLDNSHGYD